MLHTTLEKCLVYVNREKKSEKEPNFVFKNMAHIFQQTAQCMTLVRRGYMCRVQATMGLFQSWSYNYNFHVSKFHDIFNFSIFSNFNHVKMYKINLLEKSSTATFENIWPLKCVEDRFFLPSRIYSRPIS